MHFLIPALIFITTNLWGLFGGIPFTAIQPSRPLLDRTVGCFQLASTAYALEQIQPYFSQTRTVLIQGPSKKSTAPTWATNITSQREPVSRAATLTTADRESEPFPTSWAAFPAAIDVSVMFSSWSTSFSDYSDAFSDWLASFVGARQPESPRDPLFENLVLVLLVLILAIQIKQTTQYPDSTRELERLRGEVATVSHLHFLNDTTFQRTQALNERLQVVMFQQQADMYQAGLYLQRIDNGTNELLKLGKGLNEKLARTVAKVVSDHLNESMGTNTSNEVSSSGLEHGHWGNGIQN